MEPLRTAVIGTKGMGRGHIKAINQVPETTLAAVCDVVESEAKAAGEESGVPWFTDVGEMLSSGLVEAVTICTPHWYHPPVTAQCAAAGVHVLTEKPMSVTVGGADEMIDACAKAGVVLAVVYQQRFSPVRIKAKGIIDSGALGEIYRAEMVFTCCRTNFYYRSGDWRATWAGEGGGVLLNQAPHLLDQFCWQVGMMPTRVWGNIETAMHPIEVEDRASAMMEFPNGAHGYIHVSTTETPGLCRIEIAGDRGRLRMEGSRLTVHLLEGSMKEFVENTEQMFASPPARDLKAVDLSTGGDWLQGHAAHMKDLAEAVRTGARPAVTGEEGRWSVELADAVILSSFKGGSVDVPLDRGEYDELMRKLSKGRDPRSLAGAAAKRKPKKRPAKKAKAKAKAKPKKKPAKKPKKAKAKPKKKPAKKKPAKKPKKAKAKARKKAGRKSKKR